MMRRFLTPSFLIILLLFCLEHIEALNLSELCPCPNPYWLNVGPEIYYFRRVRGSGTKQTGRIDGIRVQAERIKAFCLYFGGDLLYSGGRVKGHNRRGQRLRSDLTDFIVEGRVGYTLMIPLESRPFIIPYGGYGYFEEENEFLPPSPLCYRTCDTFPFIAAGFLSGLNFTPRFSMGINIKARFMLNGRSKVTDDPDLDDVTLRMNDESQYRVEVPLCYNLCDRCFKFDALVIPFYEFRHFGGREGYPFNFIDTKFYLLGTTFAIGLRY